MRIVTLLVVGAWSALAGFAVIAPRAAQAAEPVVRNVDIRGLQIGGRTTLTIDGAELGAAPTLLLNLPGAQIERAEGNSPTKAVFHVQLGGDVVPGLYQFRVATDEGVSAPTVLSVDSLPQVAFAAKIERTPVALHGSVNGSTTLETQFTGKAGEELTIELESQRLGAKLRGVVHLLDGKRQQLAWSWPSRLLGGDARLTAKLPADGVYTIQIHDAEYGPPAPSFFRLKIGAWHRAELAFPPVIERNKTTSIELLGNLPVSKVDVPAGGERAAVAAPWPTGVVASGPRLPVLVSRMVERVEGPPSADVNAIQPADPPTGFPLPLSFSGRLLGADEQDRMRLQVAAGAKIRCEVFAERLGSPLDAVLVLQDEKGAQVARADDGPNTTDAQLEYTVPANVSQVVAVISDAQQRSGPDCIYRFMVTVVTPPPPPTPTQPAAGQGQAQAQAAGGGTAAASGSAATSATQDLDYRLLTTVDRVNVGRGGRAVLPMVVERRGYDGPIRVVVAGAPQGLSFDSVEIPAGADGCLLPVAGQVEPIAGAQTATIVSIAGVVPDGQPISGERRIVEWDAHPLGDSQPWLRSELALSFAAPTKGFQIDWNNLPDDRALLLGGKTTLPVKIVRPEGEATPVRLTFVTAQNVPRVNNNPDPNRSLRLEKPIEIAADKSDGELVVLVPAELSSAAYDVAVIAELLSKDKQKVLATSVTPVRRMKTQYPFELQLAAGSVEQTLDPKAATTVNFMGRVERRGDFTGDVTIAATGQPGGVKIDNVVVKSGASDFTVAVVFPPKFAAGDVGGIKLTASGVPDTARPNPPVRTREIALSIKLAPPPAQ